MTKLGKQNLYLDDIVIKNLVNSTINVDASAKTANISTASLSSSANLNKFTFLTIGEHDRLYKFTLAYIPENLCFPANGNNDNDNLKSDLQAKKELSDESGQMDGSSMGGALASDVANNFAYEASFNVKASASSRKVKVSAGFGLFSLKHNGEVVYALHRAVGGPVGTMKGAEVHKVIVLFVAKPSSEKEGIELLTDLVEHIATINEEDSSTEELITVYRYNIDYSYWSVFYKARSRPEKSVVLPKETKERILEDVQEFIDVETKKWYYEKGIPYKRSYLFYGVPGSGKTSIISVLAGKYKRPICYLNPTDPKMTDDALKQAVQNSPDEAIIIFEDVDGLFDKNRQSNVRNALTFSGLLNALDGVGSGLGQIFVLTTNYRDRLDSALIRAGRVDMQVEFSYVNEQQVKDMFGLFYKEADEKAKEDFFHRLLTFLPQPKISAAQLQNFFITHRKCTYDQAIDQCMDLVDDIKGAQGDKLTKGAQGESGEQENYNDVLTQYFPMNKSLDDNDDSDSTSSLVLREVPSENKEFNLYDQDFRQKTILLLETLVNSYLQMAQKPMASQAIDETSSTSSQSKNSFSSIRSKLGRLFSVGKSHVSNETIGDSDYDSASTGGLSGKPTETQNIHSNKSYWVAEKIFNIYNQV